MNTEEALQIVTLFEKAKLLKDPFIATKCAIFLQTGDTRPIAELIRNYPYLLSTAAKAAAEEEARAFKIIEPEELEKITGEISLGIIDDAGHKAGINTDDLTTHMGIFAKLGEGKSIWIESILDQLFSQDKDFNVLVFDPKGDYKHMIRNHPNLIVLKKKNIRYNHFEVHEAQSKDEIATAMKSDIDVLGDAMYFAETGLPIIEDAVDELYLYRGIYSGKNRWPTPEDVINKILARNKDTQKGYSVRDVINRIQVRFRSLVKSETFNTVFGYPLKFWTENDIIIDLEGFSNREAAVLAIGLATKIYNYNKRKDKRGHQLRTLIVIDEAYQFFDARIDDASFASNNATRNLFFKCREFGIGFLIAAQRIKDISQYVRDNLSTVAALRNTDDALNQIKKALGLSDEQTDFLRELEHKFTGILKLHNYSRPMIFDLDFDEFHVKDIDDSEIEERVRPVLEELKTIPVTMPTFPKLPADQERILNTLQGSPYLYKKMLLEESGLSQKALNTALDALLEDGFIEPEECYTSNKPATFYPLTDQGFDYLRIPKDKRFPKRLFFKHDFYKRKIFYYLRRKGYRPISEYAPTGYKGKGRIDVYAAQEGQDVAYEMTITTKNLKDNITKCLGVMKMDKLYIVTEPKQRIPIENKIKESDLPERFKEKIEVVSIAKFLGK
jgi:DNA helicase HerA-like ATPase